MSPAGVGVGRGRIHRANSLYHATTPAFHTLVCRRQPACAIAMKACPGLRSGIDRSGSHSFAIRGIPSSIRPLNSSFRRMPESRGGEGGNVALGIVPSLGHIRQPALHYRTAPCHRRSAHGKEYVGTPLRLVRLGAGVGHVDFPGRACRLEALRAHPLRQRRP